MGKNLVNFIGKITVGDQVKMHRKHSREENLSGGFKAITKKHKDKKKDADKKACRQDKFDY